MSATEQQVHEDSETRKSTKQHEQLCVKKLPILHSKMLSKAEPTTTKTSGSKAASGSRQTPGEAKG